MSHASPVGADGVDASAVTLRSVAARLNGFAFRCSNDEHYYGTCISLSIDRTLTSALVARGNWELKYGMRHRDGREQRVDERSGGDFDVDGELLYLEGIAGRMQGRGAAELGDQLWMWSVADASRPICDDTTEIPQMLRTLGMLAIARIEASGAGAAGLRFAVVAEEMERLADETSKTTVQIASNLDRVRNVFTD